MQKLFIHIPKNAGTTVRRTFLYEITIATKDNLISPGAMDHEHMGHVHARWKDVVNEIRDTHQAFAIIRNPWTRVVSMLMHGQRAMASGRLPKNYIGSTLEEFLEERHLYGNKELFWHSPIRGWYPQVDYVKDDENNIRCDIIRFEFLEIELKKYLNSNTPFISAHHRHRSLVEWDIDYRTLYNDRTIQIVADWYKDDIETFGFDFDTPATKNYWCE